MLAEVAPNSGWPTRVSATTLSGLTATVDRLETIGRGDRTGCSVARRSAAGVRTRRPFDRRRASGGALRPGRHCASPSPPCPDARLSSMASAPRSPSPVDLAIDPRCLGTLAPPTSAGTASSTGRAAAGGARPSAKAGPTMAVATFAAGCFWGVEARFAGAPRRDAVPRSATPAARPTDPTYRDVCSHRTGHAEAVRLEYDPETITYDELLDAFFAMHDPTTRDRQGPDVGSQYRSAIFFHDAGAGAAAARAAVDTPDARGPLRPADRHRDRAGGRVLARRGVPPEVRREARPRQLRGVTSRADGAPRRRQVEGMDGGRRWNRTNDL